METFIGSGKEFFLINELLTLTWLDSICRIVFAVVWRSSISFIQFVWAHLNKFVKSEKNPRFTLRCAETSEKRQTIGRRWRWRSEGKEWRIMENYVNVKHFYSRFSWHGFLPRKKILRRLETIAKISPRLLSNVPVHCPKFLDIFKIFLTFFSSAHFENLRHFMAVS